MFPITALIAMAAAPQNMTRKAGFSGGAPPIFAANAPKIPRSAMQRMDDAVTNNDMGIISAETTGNIAPMENAPADATAA